MEPIKEELLFGRIALHNKLINQQQFERALQMRRQTNQLHAWVRPFP